ncbi:CGNR zinc finger domain-containing protein [Amycolatopsis sp.]|uniref:CGNR zinc finger domain-containing protein n=1 Tax=Amycolatopsis sp. TaxID=37632 RepID=UPI002C92B75B|nr:CGNR zinc finger domain-containing protein [Amycolatopsis sp.]HVV08615.1 CGNR zinc finger domain-containing protein [Amycolatopsis sp.]
MDEPLPVELMNTVWADRVEVHDSLADPEGALAWLRGIELEGVRDWPRGVRLGEALDDLRELRDAVRVLAADVTGNPRVRVTPDDRQAAIDTVNRSCALAPQWSSLRWPDSRELHSAGAPGQALVSVLAEQVVELFSGEQRSSLRACLAPGCVRYFVKQHPRREWCSAGCGNRARVARYYQRHHGEGGN